MLTAKNIDFHQAISYYIDSENYYETTTIRWWGVGAEKLGLGTHSEEAFVNVCAGLSPDGEKLGRERSRCAIDLTFSAPKSVSLCALVAEDDRIVTAHQQAVEKTLEIIEKRYSQTRVRLPMGHFKVKSENLVVAQFDHVESRELDPHLHTHALVMNLTQVDEKDWYSLSNEKIYKHKKHLGMIYQSYLRGEVEKLGYQTTALPHGQFEIAGYSKVNLLEFSKRRQQIIAKVGHKAEWITRENAWSITRKSKLHLAVEELKQAWKEEAQALGINVVKPESIQYNSRSLLKHHLNEAIAHCSDKTVQFSLEDLEQFVLNQQLSSDVNELLPLIEQSRELLQVGEHSFTTHLALKREQETINLMKKSQGRVKAVASGELVDAYLKQSTLDSGQSEAVTLAAAKSRVIAWVGGGSGKTSALATFKTIAENSGYTLTLLAPPSEGSRVLGQELGIETSTVKHKLVSSHNLQPRSDPKQIWVVEAGLLGATETLDLLRLSEQERARVILVAERRQLSAGSPFQSLQEAGMETAFLNEGLRQTNKDLKTAVTLLSKNEIERGFEKLDSSGSILELAISEIAQNLASQYVLIPKESRSRTLVLAGTNQRRAITAAIRSQLQNLGELGLSTKATQLVSKNLSSVEMKSGSNFEIGDTVIPLRSYKQRGLVKGEHYLVKGKDNDNLVLSSNGNQVKVDTGFEKAVYRTQGIEIAVRDKLKWTKNDYKLGRTNGQEFTVENIEENQATIRSGGKTETINLQQAQHFDSALLTTCERLGKTADYVLWASDRTTDAESFYIASRAKYGVKIFTDNKRELLKALLSRKDVNPKELLLNGEGLQKKAEGRVLNQASSTGKFSPGAVEETAKQQEREGQHLQPGRGLRI